jgi:hypothetical protein
VVFGFFYYSSITPIKVVWELVMLTLKNNSLPLIAA